MSLRKLLLACIAALLAGCAGNPFNGYDVAAGHGARCRDGAAGPAHARGAAARRRAAAILAAALGPIRLDGRPGRGGQGGAGAPGARPQHFNRIEPGNGRATMSSASSARRPGSTASPAGTGRS